MTKAFQTSHFPVDRKEGSYLGIHQQESLYVFRKAVLLAFEKAAMAPVSEAMDILACLAARSFQISPWSERYPAPLSRLSATFFCFSLL